MMKSEIFTFSYPNGELQRAQLVCPESWASLELLLPTPCEDALERFFNIYKTYLVPSCPWVFGHIAMFCLPEDIDVPLSFFGGARQSVSDPLTAAAIGLKRGVCVHKGGVHFKNADARRFWQQLEKHDCVRIVHGKLPVTTIIPVSKNVGFLTECEKNAQLKVNGSFFIMDPFDCATPFDHVGRHFGLFVKDGTVYEPPLYSREALLVDNCKKAAICAPELRSLRIKIGESCFEHGKNARIYTRPEAVRSPLGKQALVIVGRRVEAVCRGSAPVPCSGFVLCPDSVCDIHAGAAVSYEGLENITFGIQVGNSIVRDGVKTEKFISRFFNIYGINRVSYPPSLYPLDFEHARAARIAIGADKNGKPMLLWAEGAPKLGYTPGKDSCGASLSEMAAICSELGMVNAVNLDGGGSAQLLVDGKRSLCLSDRDAIDYSQVERPVPMGLFVR